jgi:hypothetical protein
MTSLFNWLAKYKISTHSIAGLFSVLAVAYAGNISGFRDWVAQLTALYQSHVPHILQPVPVIVLGLWTWYRNGHNAEGNLVAVQTDKARQAGFALLRVMLFIAPSALMLLALAGCPSSQSPEVIARDAIAANKGFITSAAQKHTPECIASNGQAAVCQVIIKDAYIQNALVTSLEAYCQIPPHGLDNQPALKCSPVKSKLAALTAALQDFQAIYADIKAAAQ